MIYMDNAATTAVCERARNAMMPYLKNEYGNPSGRYGLSFNSRRAVEKSRSIIAGAINASPQEIYFTSGGTESDNWAITSVMFREKCGGGNAHMITSEIEHNAVLNTCRYLEKNGVKVTYLPVNREGQISLNDLRKSITRETRLISIMYANNEIGTIQPVNEIGKIAKANNIIFHTDAVQAFAHIPINVRKQNIGMLSASGHKLGAPKGIGFLYISKDIDIEPMIYGGGQENGKRSGTENVPGIVGLGAAASYCMEKLNYVQNYETKLRDYIIYQISERIPGVKLNGSREDRLPGNVSMSIDGVIGAAVVEELDRYGICISAGSACSAGKGEPSHVLRALGMQEERAFGTIRITVSKDNTYREADILVNRLMSVVSRLRNS